MSGAATATGLPLVRNVAGKNVSFEAVRGEVVAVDQWTDTQVSAAGGSVLILGNTVSVVPPKVWATAVPRKALWVKTASDEIQVPVPGDLQVRQGHRVHVVIATGLDRHVSQWAAIVNHDTNRWTQIDRVPPSGCYDPWTSFVMGFGQGTGNVSMGIMGLYAFLLGLMFTLVGRSGTALLWGIFLGIFIGFVHGLVGMFQSNSGVRAYRRAVEAACDEVFAGG